MKIIIFDEEKDYVLSIFPKIEKLKIAFDAIDTLSAYFEIADIYKKLPCYSAIQIEMVLELLLYTQDEDEDNSNLSCALDEDDFSYIKCLHYKAISHAVYNEIRAMEYPFAMAI